jgi:hypothetical protein
MKKQLRHGERRKRIICFLHEGIAKDFLWHHKKGGKRGKFKSNKSLYQFIIRRKHHNISDAMHAINKKLLRSSSLNEERKGGKSN